MTRKLFTTVLILFSFTFVQAQEKPDSVVTLGPYYPPLSLPVVRTIKREFPRTPLVANVSQVLQGRMAGVFATSTNGRPGSPAAIFVRGRNTIDGDSEPYYLVNDVPTTAAQLSTINVEDIESLTVLKDAVATAIYGVNGGNGVVLIKTKRGASGRPKVELSAEAGVSRILKNRFNLMDTRQKLDYELGLGFINQSTYDARLPYNYNQIDEIFQTGSVQSYNLQVSGGNDNTTYYVSGGYFAQDGILDNSDFNRYTLNANVTTRAAKWLQFGMSMYAGTEKNTYPLTAETGVIGDTSPINLPYAALRLNPYERLKNADGSYNKSLETYPANPLYEASNFNDRAGTTTVNGTAFFDITFSPKFSFKSSIVLGDVGSDVHGNYFDDTNLVSKYWDSNAGRTTIVQTNKLSYNTSFDDYEHHRLKLSLSEEMQSVKKEEDYANNQLSFSSGTSPSFSGATYTIRDRILSGLLQAGYSYRDLFFLDATYRLDRVNSSRVQEADNATAWSVGAKWNIIYKYYADEWLSRLSLRGSVGKVGKLPFQESYYSNGLQSSSSQKILYPHNLSTLLESTKSHGLAAEAYLFRNRLSITAEYYQKQTSNASSIYRISSSISPYYTHIFSSDNEIQNRGFELTADWHIIAHWKYFLTLNANLSLNENKLINAAYGQNGLINGVTTLKVGEPVGSYALQQWAGVNSLTGQAMWLDGRGQPTTNPYAIEQLIEGKSYIPSKYAGIMLSGGYKGISLSAQLYGIWDVYTYNANMQNLSNANTARNHNMPTTAADYWKKAGDITDIPKPFSYGADYADTRWLQNRSYFRLENISLAYDFDKRVLRALEVVQACRLYVSAQNLFTITGYKGYTPEVLGSQDNAGYPESVTISGGIKITF